jgi:hypothetical protein
MNDSAAKSSRGEEGNEPNGRSLNFNEIVAVMKELGFVT